jgi:hypothetical protein
MGVVIDDDETQAMEIDTDHESVRQPDEGPTIHVQSKESSLTNGLETAMRPLVIGVSVLQDWRI